MSTGCRHYARSHFAQFEPRQCTDGLFALSTVGSTVYRDETNLSLSPGDLRRSPHWKSSLANGPIAAEKCRRAGNAEPVDLRAGLAAGGIDPRPVDPGLRDHRVHLPGGRGRADLLHRPLPASRGRRDDRTAAGLRQQADRDRLDGGPGADRFHPDAGHDPYPLGGRTSTAARTAAPAISRCSSR